MTASLSESLITKIWQSQLRDRTDLTTEEGEPIRIVYPGRINDDQGADLLDAVIATRRGLVKGDIEVHVKSSGWRAHGHHRDPAYNRVILHVAIWHDSELATELENGTKIPVLALHKYLSSERANSAYPSVALNTPCHQAVNRLPANIIAGLLDRAGKERFLAKAARFQADLAENEARQCLYQGIMVALGYSKNKISFLELARRLPIRVLESLAKRKTPEEESLARQQALLLGTAGLLPSQRLNWHQKNKIDDHWIEKLERLWASAQHAEAMSENDWHLYKVRPGNSPVRRIVAMSYLILRYRETGLMEEVIDRIREIAPGTRYLQLEKMLLTTTDSYWASHFDFGSANRLSAPALLGDGRAADIVVNVLLPFVSVWGKFASQPELVRKAFELYCRHPRLAMNTLEKHMERQLGLTNELVSSARRQQGLVHIYKTLCSQGKCQHCALAGSD